MTGIKKVEEIVEKILDIRKDARVSDDILYMYVCEYFCNGVSNKSVKQFLKHRESLGCPNYASVSRARRKVFEKRPELKPKKVTQLRKDLEQDFKDYATS